MKVSPSNHPGLIDKEDDEVLYAIAEELGQVFNLMSDKTIFFNLLESLCKVDETVVREQAAKSMTEICKHLTDNEVHNVYAPLVIRLANSDWFTGKVSAAWLLTPCYPRSGPQKEKLRKKFIELCNDDTPMIRRACAAKFGHFATQLDKQHILQELLPTFR